MGDWGLWAPRDGQDLRNEREAGTTLPRWLPKDQDPVSGTLETTSTSAVSIEIRGEVLKAKEKRGIFSFPLFHLFPSSLLSPSFPLPSLFLNIFWNSREERSWGG